ncbi:MAG: universal stress protein, partial [Pirellulaceae bacterium]|nr:universal stress protein [Pirellulaceae bacterium]
MDEFKKILVATDTRFETDPVVDEAVEIAKINQASLTLVDVIPDFSWMVRLTLKDHVHMRELIEQEKQQKLEALVTKIRDKGVDAHWKLLRGKTSIAIIREVLRSNHDLVIRVTKNRESRNAGFFGNTGSRLLRKCPCALLLISP